MPGPGDWRAVGAHGWPTPWRACAHLYGRIVAGKTGYVTIARPSGDDKILASLFVHPKFQGKIIGEVVGEGPTRQSALDNIRFEGGLRRYLVTVEQGLRERMAMVGWSKLEFFRSPSAAGPTNSWPTAYICVAFWLRSAWVAWPCARC